MHKTIIMLIGASALSLGGCTSMNNDDTLASAGTGAGSARRLARASARWSAACRRSKAR